MQNFRNLDVWGKAHKLTIDVYRATAMFPKSELYGLTSQMRRASASIGANIAEGCGRRGNTELGRFLHIAMGSASELEYQLLLARDLQMLSDPEHRRLDVLVTELKRMLSRLIKSMPPEQHTN
jgi:four helix bundle protein